MIHFDATKAQRAGHVSGLVRVSARLLDALGEAAAAVSWTPALASGVKREDWFVTPELFDEHERPGFGAFLRSGSCRTAAIYHDAIPLRHPEWTWPRSVERHPGYMEMLAGFDLVLAVSESSRAELLAYWRWMGLERVPPVEVLPLGADFDGTARSSRTSLAAGSESGRPVVLLCVGIIEPRKDQVMLAEACVPLWQAGLRLDLHIAGRVNPHFGKVMDKRLRSLAREHRGLQLHHSPSDKQLAALYAKADVLVLPSRAEGCGLPLLEALWRGVPCIASDLPALRENAAGGGCRLVPSGDQKAWEVAIASTVSDRALLEQLAEEARRRPLCDWRTSASLLVEMLAR